MLQAIWEGRKKSVDVVESNKGKGGGLKWKKGKEYFLKETGRKYR